MKFTLENPHSATAALQDNEKRISNENSVLKANHRALPFRRILRHATLSSEFDYFSELYLSICVQPKVSVLFCLGHSIRFSTFQRVHFHFTQRLHFLKSLIYCIE